MSEDIECELEGGAEGDCQPVVRRGGECEEVDLRGGLRASYRARGLDWQSEERWDWRHASRGWRRKGVGFDDLRTV